MLVFGYIVAFVLWIIFTWGLFHFTLIAYKEKQIWNAAFGTICSISAFSGLVYAIIKLIA